MKIDNWFTGIIEDVDASLSRVRVRMFGLHSFSVKSDNIAEIRTTDLPWSTLLLPTTSSTGTTPSIHNLIGKCAFGFFRDGDDMQDSVVIGIYTGSWNQTQNAAYNPLFSATAFTPANVPANSFSGTLNVGSSVIGGSASSGYRPNTAAHGTGLLEGFNQNIAKNSYNASVSNKILEAAYSQINKNISYQRNSSPIAEYFSATDLGRSAAAERQPWCAAFVCWCIKQSGLFSEDIRPKTALAYGFYDWAKPTGKVSDRVIRQNNPAYVQPGDIVAFNNRSHVGIVKESFLGNNGFKTIEGNTSGTIAERTRQLYNVKYIVRITQ